MRIFQESWEILPLPIGPSARKIWCRGTHQRTQLGLRKRYMHPPSGNVPQTRIHPSTGAIASKPIKPDRSRNPNLVQTETEGLLRTEFTFRGQPNWKRKWRPPSTRHPPLLPSPFSFLPSPFSLLPSPFSLLPSPSHTLRTYFIEYSARL